MTKGKSEHVKTLAFQLKILIVGLSQRQFAKSNGGAVLSSIGRASACSHDAWRSRDGEPVAIDMNARQRITILHVGPRVERSATLCRVSWSEKTSRLKML
jgi:hypothetical protein